MYTTTKVSLSKSKLPDNIFLMSDRWRTSLFVDDVLTQTHTTMRSEEIKLEISGSHPGTIPESCISEETLSVSGFVSDKEIYVIELGVRN